MPTRAQQRAMGKALRERCPRAAHGTFDPKAAPRDALALIKRSNEGRLRVLLPIRHQRMLQSPFHFYRGTADLMAHDLAGTPATGFRVQACGDCHLANFGAFATPERNLVFDINDFDETLPAPWEWDVKRLAASFLLAARFRGLTEPRGAELVRTMVRTYRERTAELARLGVLDVWYARLDVEGVLALAASAAQKRWLKEGMERARSHTSAAALPKLTEMVDGERRIADRPPLIFHMERRGRAHERLMRLFRRYRETLEDDRRHLLDSFRITDNALKVVGVGSVGTRCGILLLAADADDGLFLQVKEARASVLEPYAGRSRCANHGERVIRGQRLIQAASDLFLGWTRDETDGRDYYFRQLKDMKMSLAVETMSPEDLELYAMLCGWVLARASAKAGSPAVVGGYLGGREVFDEAIVKFSGLYADQVESDYAAFAKACKAGRFQTEMPKSEKVVGF